MTQAFCCWCLFCFVCFIYVYVFSSYLPSSVDKHFENIKDVTALLLPDGTIHWHTPVILYTSCRIDVRLFPFDTQHCKLRFGSWAHNIDEMNIGVKNESEASKYFVENSIWEFEHITIGRLINDYGDFGWVFCCYNVFLYIFLSLFPFSRFCNINGTCLE